MITRADPARAAERALFLLHVPALRREAVAALLALDDRLAQLVEGGREPRLRPIRLAWWRDALAALDDAPPPAEPLLVALAGSVLPAGVSGERLAAIAAGWGALLDEPLDAAALEAFGDQAGSAMFAVLAEILEGEDARYTMAGAGWALAGLARRAGGLALGTLAGGIAAERLDVALARRWPRRLRPLAMLAALARSDLAGPPPNSPARAALLWRVRLFGR